LTQAKGTDFWKLLAAWCILSQVDLPDWEEFQGVSRADVLDREKRTMYSRKIRESIPDWLDELGERELGKEKWDRELSALNEEAPVVLRTNPRRPGAGRTTKYIYDPGFQGRSL
jgi:16S rRNA (cytosine967-C5)-methyltransferase